MSRRTLAHRHHLFGGLPPVDVEVPPVTVAIQVAASPGNGGTAIGAGSYVVGQPVTVTATTASGYGFSGWWNGSGVRVSTQLVYVFTATASVTLTALFYDLAAVANTVPVGRIFDGRDRTPTLSPTLSPYILPGDGDMVDSTMPVYGSFSDIVIVATGQALYDASQVWTRRLILTADGFDANYVHIESRPKPNGQTPSAEASQIVVMPEAVYNGTLAGFPAAASGDPWAMYPLSGQLPRIYSDTGNAPALSIGAGCYHMRFVGIEFTILHGALNESLIRTHDAAEHIGFDRILVRKDDMLRRIQVGITLGGAKPFLVDSWIGGITSNTESKAVLCYGQTSGRGGKIVDCYIEGSASICLWFGGAGPGGEAQADYIPRGWEVRRVHLHRPPEFNYYHPKWVVGDRSTFRRGALTVQEYAVETGVLTLADGSTFDTTQYRAQPYYDYAEDYYIYVRSGPGAGSWGIIKPDTTNGGALAYPTATSAQLVGAHFWNGEPGAGSVVEVWSRVWTQHKNLLECKGWQESFGADVLLENSTTNADNQNYALIGKAAGTAPDGGGLGPWNETRDLSFFYTSCVNCYGGIQLTGSGVPENGQNHRYHIEDVVVVGLVDVNQKTLDPAYNHRGYPLSVYSQNVSVRRGVFTRALSGWMITGSSLDTNGEPIGSLNVKIRQVAGAAGRWLHGLRSVWGALTYFGAAAMARDFDTDTLEFHGNGVLGVTNPGAPQFPTASTPKAGCQMLGGLANRVEGVMETGEDDLVNPRPDLWHPDADYNLKPGHPWLALPEADRPHVNWARVKLGLVGLRKPDLPNGWDA